MKVSFKTISAIEKIITGNPVAEQKSFVPYRSGPDLIDFFHEFGSSDEYGQGFPSRWLYVENKLKEYNGTTLLKDIIEAALDPRVFLGTDFEPDEAVSYINEFLKYDGYVVRRVGKFYRVMKSQEDLVKVSMPFLPTGMPNYEFVREQIEKCEIKITSGDFDGAITNARSLVEAVLTSVESLLDDNPSKYDGNLGKLYKRVQKLLHLDPEQKEISDSLRQILRGFVSVVAGLGSMRNKMSDAHVRNYKPHEHHARLAVNSARTITDFVLGTLEYQLRKGRVVIKKEDAT
jgi:hypothetical protein